MQAIGLKKDREFTSSKRFAIDKFIERNELIVVALWSIACHAAEFMAIHAVNLLNLSRSPNSWKR